MKYLIAFALALFTLGAQAGAFTVSQSGTARTYTFASDTIGGGSTSYTANFPPGGKYSPSVSSSGSFGVDVPQRLPVASGRTVDVAARVVPEARVVAGAVARFASKVATPLVVGVALWDLCNELGFRCSGGADQPVTVTKTDPTACTSSPCYAYNANATGFTGSYPSMSSACSAYASTVSIANQNATLGGTIKTVVGPSGTSQCQFVLTDGRTVYPNIASRVSVPPVTATYNPSSMQELQDAIAAKSGWPTSSNLPRVVSEIIQTEGIPVPAPSSITGPSTVQGPQTTSTTPAQNGQPAKSTTTNTVSNVTYGPNTVSIVNNTTTSVNNGTTTTTETKTEEPEPIPTDTDLPAQPKLYTPKYPDGLTGVWNAKKADILASPLARLPASLQPTIAAPNGYPSWPIPFVIGKWNWGTYDVSPSPLVWDFLKICILISAGFLCRAIIFGG